MNNEKSASKPNNQLTNMLMQLLHWRSRLELSGGYAGEQDIGQWMPLPAYSISILGNKKFNNQHKNEHNMKTKHQMLKRLALLLMLVASTMGVMAQGPYPSDASTQTVCITGIAEPYGVINNPGSTYSWKVDGATTSANWDLTATNTNLATILWKTAGIYVVQVSETTPDGCVQPNPVEVTVTVKPFPILNNDVASVCSGSPIGVTLATSSTNGLTVDKWDITASVAPLLTGTATIGTGLTSTAAIAVDVFTNTTGGPLDVVYTVTPYSGTYVGASFTITVTITSAPQTSPIYHN